MDLSAKPLIRQDPAPERMFFWNKVRYDDDVDDEDVHMVQDALGGAGARRGAQGDLPEDNAVYLRRCPKRLMNYVICFY